ncbi:hypothetical protein HMPREF1508_0339 [Shuttleworthella sp. MSX8B]|nr:hypothetical protein HMPREF1508_0339 [Shuttleworthia sp. MSX8B]
MLKDGSAPMDKSLLEKGILATRIWPERPWIESILTEQVSGR